jgi:hypothetical protein
MVLQRLVLTGLLGENDGIEVPARYSVKSMQCLRPSLNVTIMTHMLRKDGFFGDVMQTLLQGEVITKAFLVQNNITSAPVADQVELWFEKRRGGKHVSLTDLLNSMAQVDSVAMFGFEGMV